MKKKGADVDEKGGKVAKVEDDVVKHKCEVA